MLVYEKVTTTFEGEGEPVAELELEHHAANRRIIEKSETIGGAASIDYGYTYDGLGRLTAVSDGSTTVEHYTYDAQGRRTSGNGLAYTYNDDDQLLAAGSGVDAVVYDYNANGYRTERMQNDVSTLYSYTTAGQLVGVSGDAMVDPVTYQLDAAGRRVAKLVDNVVQEKYLWAGHNTTLLAVYDDSDTLVARFEYGVGRMPVRMTQNSATYYFAYDQVGSLRAVFDDAGVLVHEITYDSYGNIITDETTSGFESVYIPPFGFAGGLHDRDTGMVLFGFRDYDPETGTWLTPDPIGFAGGDVYLYGYCGCDPVNCVDPEGLLAWYDTLLNWSANAAAGVGDELTLGLTGLAREYMPTLDGCGNVNEAVNRDSGEYYWGGWFGFGLGTSIGPGRMAYAGAAKASSIYYLRQGATLNNAYKASAVRAGLKKGFNFLLSPKSPSPLSRYLQYRNAEDMIRASGRTNDFLFELAKLGSFARLADIWGATRGIPNDRRYKVFMNPF